MILAVDLGGTKCNLMLFEVDGQRLRQVHQFKARTADFRTIEDFIAQFRAEARQSGHALVSVAAAGFGVAGAIVNNEVVCNNLPWTLNHSRIAAALKLQPERLVLLNDVEAAASSLQHLEEQDLLTLNHGSPQPRAPKLYVAAGTGLGESILFWNGERYQVSACEAGLSDFAPGTEREIVLLERMHKTMPRVCTEELVSGRGFRAIHENLFPDARHSFFNDPSIDAAAKITQQAFAKSCPACEETLHMWVQIYGSEAGNMAIRVLPFGGVYIGGGIALKILETMKDGTFVRAFCDKTKLGAELARIPIHVVLNQDAPVLGAAYTALAAS